MGEGGGRDGSLLQRDEYGMTDWMDELGKVQVPRQTLNKLVMNYLVTEGFKDAAERFKEESGVGAEIDLNLLDTRISIRDSIQGGKMEAAISLINDLHPSLLDEQRYLLFHLHQQQLIELIREQRVEEALEFAANHLAERGEEDTQVLKELERTLALLAFEDPFSSPFSDLLSLNHRQQVAGEVNEAILKAENAESAQSQLATSLKQLIWAQDELDKKKVKYPHITDLASGKLQESK
jgi:hypothetical protein